MPRDITPAWPYAGQPHSAEALTAAHQTLLRVRVALPTLSLDEIARLCDEFAADALPGDIVVALAEGAARQEPEKQICSFLGALAMIRAGRIHLLNRLRTHPSPN